MSTWSIVSISALPAWRIDHTSITRIGSEGSVAPKIEGPGRSGRVPGSVWPGGTHGFG